MADVQNTQGSESPTKVAPRQFVSEAEKKSRSGEKVVFPIPQEEQLAVKHAARERRLQRKDEDDY